MKKLLCIVLVIALIQTTSAKCTGNGIFPLHKNDTLPANGILILEFYAASQSLISSLNNKYPVYMQCGEEKIRLNVAEIFKGEFRVTQVIFKPERSYKINKVYELKIDNLPEYEQLGRFSQTYNKRDPLTFTIVDSDKASPPVITGTPRLINMEKQEFGCGPARWAYFDLGMELNTTQLVQVKLTDKATGKSALYIFTVEKGQVKIGHGMCSGAFHFKDGADYDVSFAALDATGRKGNSSAVASFLASA
ncbi:MAG: hypothetical protein ACTHLE_11865 [Agriterribacter sp.]